MIELLKSSSAAATANALVATKLDTLHTDVAANTAAVVEKTPNAGSPAHADNNLDPDTTEQLISANVDRMYVLVVNTGANPLKLCIDGQVAGASSANGIYVPAGGAWENPSHFCPKGIITAWSLLGTSVNVTIA